MANQDFTVSRVDEIWEELKGGTLSLYRGQTMPIATGMRLFTYVFSSGNLRENVYDQTGRLVRVECMNAKPLLVQRLDQLTRTVLAEIVDTGTGLCDHADILKFYAQKWESFKDASMPISTIWRAVNGQDDDVGRRPFTVRQMLMRLWREHVVQLLQTKLTPALTSFAQDDRTGQISADHRALVKSVFGSFDELDGEEEEQSDTVFRKLVEEHYLESSKVHISLMSGKVNTTTVDEYVEEANTLMERVKRQTEIGIPSSTIEKLMAFCREELIQRHFDVLCESIMSLLPENQPARIWDLFSFLSKSKSSHARLAAKIRDYTHNQCVDAFQDGDVYLHAVVRLVNLFLNFGRAVFREDSRMIAAIWRGLQDAITSTLPAGQSLSIMLAMLYDDVLKRGDIDDKDLNEMFLVYNLLESKDAFFGMYTKLCAMRLACNNNEAVNGDAESRVIQQFTDNAGPLAVQHLTQLYKDWAMSNELNLEFDAAACHGLPYVFRFAVFDADSWPHLKSCDNLSLPAELETAAVALSSFYGAKFHGKRLTLLYDKSCGVLRSNCFEKGHLFRANTYQIVVLMAFNETDSMSFARLEKKVGFSSSNHFRSVLTTLLESSLLVSSTLSDLQDDTTLSLNTGYADNRAMIKLDEDRRSAPVDVKRLDHDIKRDRCVLIQSAIVRILKVHKKMEHSQLSFNVREQLSSRFNPSDKMMQDCLEVLIIQDYICRSTEEEDTYLYVA